MFIPAQKISRAFLRISRASLRVRRGFTLIELLIVIAILGILAAAVLVAVNPTKRQNQAKDAGIKSDIGQIATAAQAYYTAPGTGTYPGTTATLVTNKDLKQLPKHPDNTDYVYTKAPSATCAGTVVDPCTEVAISGALYDFAVAGNVWCWRSSTGKATEVAAVACTAP